MGRADVHTAVVPIDGHPRRLQLRNGVEIADGLTTALEFIAKDGTYQTYDLAPVLQDNILTNQDVRTANRIIARMSDRVITAILAHAPMIQGALSHISPSASLMAADEEIPWAGLEQLLQAMTGIPEVGLARATKVLHKKRPALIPILDEVVAGYLREVERPSRRRDFVHNGLDLIREYKRELDANARNLRIVRDELAMRDFVLTECRLLDIYLWAYSGTYTPAWQRLSGPASLSPDRSPRDAPEGHVAASPGELQLDIGLTLYRDDEAGYLGWLAAHPNGVVLNAARRPDPSYLVLHRSACRTISGQPARGGLWTGSYIKVCADLRTTIEQWVENQLHGAAHSCQRCW